MFPSSRDSTVLFATVWAEVPPRCVHLLLLDELGKHAFCAHLLIGIPLGMLCICKAWLICRLDKFPDGHARFVSSRSPFHICGRKCNLGALCMSTLMLIYHPFFIWANSATWLRAIVFCISACGFFCSESTVGIYLFATCVQEPSTPALFIQLAPHAQVSLAWIIAIWSFLASSDSNNCPQ